MSKSKEKLNTLIEEVKEAVLDEVMEELEKMFEDFANGDFSAFSALRENLMGDQGPKGDKGDEGKPGGQGAPGLMGKDGNPGRDANKAEIISEVLMQIPDPKPGIDGQDGTSGSPDTGEQIVNKVNDLPIESVKQIDVEHIKNITQLIKRYVKEMTSQLGEVAGGGGITLETPTGTVNSVNTVFYVVNLPKYLIIDGIAKFETTHYTLTGSRIDIIDGSPPTQFIRAIL